MLALDKIWLSINIYSLADNPSLATVLLLTIVVVHVSLICISFATIGLAIWSQWNYPEWSNRSYAAVLAACAYLLVTFWLFG